MTAVLSPPSTQHPCPQERIPGQSELPLWEWIHCPEEHADGRQKHGMADRRGARMSKVPGKVWTPALPTWNLHLFIQLFTQWANSHELSTYCMNHWAPREQGTRNLLSRSREDRYQSVTDPRKITLREDGRDVRERHTLRGDLTLSGASALP